MPRIRPLSRSEVRPDVLPAYDRMFGEGVDPTTDPDASSSTGTPGHYVSVWAHAPDIRSAMFAFPWSKAAIDPKLRELAMMRTGYVVGSQFVYSQHCKMARDVGLDEARIRAVPFWPVSNLFDERERAVLAYVDCVVLQQGRVHDEIFAALNGQLPEDQVLELTYFTTLYVTHALHCKALRLEYDDVPDRIVEIPAPAERGLQDWDSRKWIDQART